MTVAAQNPGVKSGLRITRLEVQNFKAVKMVDLSPAGESLVLGGRNGAGKSSCIDAYLVLMAGAKATCARPIRDGASKALIGVEFTNGLTVRKVITAGGVKLEVRDPSGALMGSPQGVLDALTGGTAFDISEFVHLDPKKQVEILRQISGLNLALYDNEIQDTFDARTDANRVVKRLQAQLDGVQPVDPGTPAAEVSVADLTETIEMARAENDANRAAREALRAEQQRVERVRAEIAVAEEKLENLRQAIVFAQNEREALVSDLVELSESVRERQDAVAGLQDVDIAPLRAQIADAERINAAVRRAATRRGLQAELDKEAARAAELTAHLEECRAARQAAIEAADLPVQGLGMEDGQITYKGVPYDQISESERYMVAAAIGLRRIPADGARVLIMRNGGALDTDNLAMIQQVMADADAQLLVEVPRASDGVDIVIEDGEIQKGE